MKTLKLIPLSLIVLAAACGGGNEGTLPDENTLFVDAPDDTAINEAPLCSKGEDAYKGDLKKELDELNDAARPYVVLYRAVRATGKAAAKGGGEFERKWSGPRGSITITTAEQDDGTFKTTVTAAKKGEEDKERTLLTGTAAADGKSGTWSILGKDGSAFRTVSWTNDGTTITANWKNEKNGKTAVYTKNATTVTIEVTLPSGAKHKAQWDRATKAGSAEKISASGQSAKKCWDATFCDIDCAS